MPEFLELLPPRAALERLFKALPHFDAEARAEQIPVIEACDRVTTHAVLAPEPLPPFARSTVDGFAVRAQDTYGASESLPAYFNLLKEIPMGQSADFRLTPGSCALIHTGGMLPVGADAVVMVEYTQMASTDEVEVLRPAAVGENILRVGEDVQAGEVIVSAHHRLRPSEIGGLSGLGILEVQVARKPLVGVISTGDEVVPPEAALQPGQVRDVNTYTLSALISRQGGEPRTYGIVPDHPAELEQTAARALKECDLVVITAGSSASTRDLTADVINRVGEPGVLVHGVNVRPGKPTILGVCEHKAVIGLPGNPVSALVIAGLFVTPLLERMVGLVHRLVSPVVSARLTINLASTSGREDWIPVKLLDTETGLLAEPVFGKSNLIFTLARADGLICIPADANGLPAGEDVTVHLM
jgi:molybdopterin molybdotransferase